jgi:hypothetical protein
MEETLIKILNVYRIPQELLKTANNNLSTIKIQQEQFKKKIENKLNNLK